MKNSRVVENKEKINVVTPIDMKSDKSVYSQLMKPTRKAKTLDTKLTFLAGELDMEIIEAGREKHGLKKVSEVIRMALRRFAEAEDLKLKAS
jgi:hypothetical protein